MSPHVRRAPVTVAVTSSLLILATGFTGAAHAQDGTLATPTAPPQTALSGRLTAPVTDDCPWATTPAAPVDASEVPAAGAPLPSLLPVPATHAGGPQMSACGVVAAPAFIVPEDQTATSWIVFDLDSGDVLAAKDPHGRYRPASIIKVLLALVVLDRLDLDREVTIGHDSAAMEGSRVGIVEGGRYTVEQLLQGLLMASGNDAAHALAQELGGDERTLELINTKTLDLGTQDTRVATYSGLDGPGMSTSAFDMALAYRAAWENEVFARIVRTDHVDFPGAPDGDSYQVWNDNHLLLNDSDSIGGKTGFTDDARHTFVGAMERHGRRLATVVLDTTTDKGRPWEQAQRLLNAGYAVPPQQSVGVVEKLAPAAPTSTASTMTSPTPEPAPSTSGAETDPRTVTLRLPAWKVAAMAVGGIFLGALLFGIALNRVLSKRNRARRTDRRPGSVPRR
ncbi:MULTISPECIES: D-alanyl-D-alanine carboxypeptidase family protein [unclassified Corynebacterium]|uniref:D-alanyl-D-alanine carboxypeptidase family protein n=1 Tax=unclassified Corynebacterium TaxID=2624378 RepID=UPI003523C1B3